MTWSKSTIECHVCGEDMELQNSWEGNYLTEQSGTCKNCCLFCYEYMTGFSGYWLWPYGQHADLVTGYTKPDPIVGWWDQTKYDVKRWLVQKYWNWIGKYRKENENDDIHGNNASIP